jgi:mannosyl-3-phosphoglycerate synthase
MRLQALNALYHSPVSLPPVRQEILAFLRGEGTIGIEEEPPPERVYPPVAAMDLDRLLDVLGTEASTFCQVERRRPTAIQVEPPIPRRTEPPLP